MFKITKTKQRNFKTLILASIGGGMEMYDFVVFAIFASYIGTTFFPASTPLISIIKTFMLFALGYFMRPIGGIIFGHIGDKIGRKKTLMITILTMGISSILMGLVPSYRNWGVTATVIFSILRLFQGLALGGEIPGSITFISEVFKLNKGFAVGIMFFFINLSTLTAQGMMFLFVHFSSANFLANYSWRIAFVVGGILSLILFVFRRKLIETPMFIEKKSITSTRRFPALVVITKYPLNFLAGFLVVTLAATIPSLLYIFMPSFLISIADLPKDTATNYTLLSIAIFTVLNLLFGYLGDKIGRLKIYIVANIAFIFLPYWLYSSIDKGGSHTLAIMLVFTFLSAAIISIFPMLLAEVFPTKIRYSGISMVYNIAFAIFGGLSPFVATIIVRFSSITNVFWIFTFTAILSLIGTILIISKNMRKNMLS